MNIPTERLIRELSRPEAFPETTRDIRVVQTHISVIFITENRVYKVKKPVDFGFLDFTTPEKRLRFCTEEVELNRRLSPDLYLGVLPVTEEGDLLRFGGSGPALDYAVLMNRLQEDRLLPILLEKHEVTPEMIERVAAKVARFHLQAATSPEITRIGGSDAIHTNTEENFEQIQPYIGHTLSQATFDLLADFTRTFRDVNRELFLRRESEGWIRDGHGDLHTQHICLTGDIQIYDCIEFNRRFRYSDVLCDAAFLAMDLRMKGRKDLADLYTRKYLEFTGQGGTEALYNFYACYRAVVRGKVEGFRSRDPDVNEKEAQRAAEDARGFFHLAGELARAITPPGLIITCGLMGSGKSSLAAGLAEKFDLEVISTDRVRKELAGMDPLESKHVPYGGDIYSSEFTDRTYRELSARSEALLKSGASVILDGTFLNPGYRSLATETARKTGSHCIFIYLNADEQLLRSRLRQRLQETSVSDGREEILADQIKAAIPPDEISKDRKLDIDARLSGEKIVTTAYRRLLSTS
ncbi:shikimate kinase [bacterium BMS3Abin14]|nr:shikimate kinase [bacterium BMS3Abin14]